MMAELGNELPSIIISSDKFNDRLLRELEAGIEEEGIPFKVYNNNMKLIQKPYNTSLMSKFGIGISASMGILTTYYSKLPPQKPLFFSSVKEDDFAIARNFGANAARLYKGLPFKPLKNDDGLDKKINSDSDDTKYSKDIVKKIVETIVKNYKSSKQGWR